MNPYPNPTPVNLLNRKTVIDLQCERFKDDMTRQVRKMKGQG